MAKPVFQKNQSLSPLIPVDPQRLDPDEQEMDFAIGQMFNDLNATWAAKRDGAKAELMKEFKKINNTSSCNKKMLVLSAVAVGVFAGLTYFCRARGLVG